MNVSVLFMACALDTAIGDPRWLPHPIRLMGRVIIWYERGIRSITSNRVFERVAGVILALGLPTVSYGAAWLAIDQANRVDEVLSQGIEALLAYTTIAARDLADHAWAVKQELAIGSLEKARGVVSRIVGRDTAQLSEGEIVRGTVESVAESTADGIVAPLFYLVLGGPPLALAYKAINTLDSMIGHLDDRHRYFGWASARLDDVANWVPARITALLIVVSAGVVKRDVGATRRAWRVLWHDGNKHQSPNSGHPEAAMAGSLGVQLGGTSYYDGMAMARPLMGEASQALDPNCVSEAIRIMWSVFFLGTLFAACALWL